jgi:DNA replication protein DnaC
MEKLEDRIRSRLTDTTLSQICVVKEEQDLSEYGWGAEFELQKSMTFDRFERRINLPPEQQQNLENALELALNFAKSPEGWLVFMGVTGCGKTHLAAAIKNYRNQARQPALFVVVPEFLDHLRSTFSPESKVSYDQLFEKVKTAPLLILDDFGEQSTTPWAKEKLYQVISYRHNAQLPTVITTRYNLDEISENIETAITSRMLNWKFNMVFGITAPDYRTSRDSGKKPNRSKRGRWS